METSAKRFVVRNDKQQYLITDGIFVDNIKDPKVDVRNVAQAGGYFVTTKERLKEYARDYSLVADDLKLFCFSYNEMYRFRCCKLDSKEYPKERSDIYLVREY